MNPDDPRIAAGTTRRVNDEVAPGADRRPEEIEREIENQRARMSDTIEAIQHRLSPGQLLDQVLEYTRHGPGEYITHLGASVKDNPMPATLVAIGLGWMMATGTGTHMRDYQPRRTGAGGATTDRLKAAAGRTSAAVGDAVHRVGEAARSARDSVAGALHGHDHPDADTSPPVGERLRETGRHARESARYYAERASGGWERLVREQPLVLGAIGLAIGAALGAGLPPTRREDELIGDYRDDLVDGAVETGREQLERGKRVAAAAASAAASEAERHAAGEAGSGKAEAIAQAAAAAAKDEAQRQGLTSGAPGGKTGGDGGVSGATTAAGSAGGTTAAPRQEPWSPSAPRPGSSGASGAGPAVPPTGGTPSGL